MIDPQNVPSVSANEMLARFVFSSSHVRGDNSVKPDAFIPHPYNDLSVTRHREATDVELWAVGNRIGEERQRTLHGRADVNTGTFLEAGLRVNADPIAENPNHAIAVGWPAEKSQQKLIAVTIAKQSAFRTQTTEP